MAPWAFVPLFAVSLFGASLLGASSLAGCDRDGAVDSTVGGPKSGLPGSASPTSSAALSAVPTLGSSSLADGSAAPLSRSEFAELVITASEKGEYFFSDNLISNETDNQKTAAVLRQLTEPGGAYIGVGPEQNFTFMALTQPSLAVIVDLRRDNLLQHLWYKALFELASSRFDYLCLWLSRGCAGESDPGAKATLEEVLNAVRASKKSTASFVAVGERIDARLQEFGIPLSKEDQKHITQMRSVFFADQLKLRFTLHETRSRSGAAYDYPTLERLLTETDDTGKQRGFLAHEASFRFLQQMQTENRVVPLVGDFAGDHAMPAVAKLLQQRGLSVSLFYVSNVEQYLFEGDTWAHWVRNLDALPTDDKSLIARVHLDQGQKHPRAHEGHRSTTVLQRFEQFAEHQARKPYKNVWELVTEDTLVLPEE